MNQQDKPIFLLGGKDLEMEEIRRVLDKDKATYFDKQLTWQAANLSAYKDKLNKHTTYYAIELNIDLQGYDNVKIIDHLSSRYLFRDSRISWIGFCKLKGYKP